MFQKMARLCNVFKKTLFAIRPVDRNLSLMVKDQPKSSLFISGKRAQDTFVAVIPKLDFDERFENIKDLKENIKRRKLNLNVDELKESWEFYKDWNDKKNKLQNNLDETVKRMNELLQRKENQDMEKEIETLERHKKMLKEELHEVKENLWAIEDNVLGNLLKLPNDLHQEAPEKEEEIFLFDIESPSKGSDHLNTGKKLNLIEYYNQYTCFLKNEAAVFELSMAEFCAHHFIEKGFIRFSNPDFTRSALAEGVGVDPGSISELFLLENTEGNNDPLHFCGGASIFPFCGFHAKHVVQKESLPVRYIASGRRYTPKTPSLPGLYSLYQSTSVQVFVATHCDDVNDAFDSCLKSFQELYDRLGLKFRIVKEPPHAYKKWESYRVTIQVFSSFYGCFIEVGHLSLVGDFISKRLRMCYSSNKGESFLNVVYGTVVDVQALLAICLECSQDKLFSPEILRQFSVM